MPNLDLLISPKSIAIVGASNDPKKVGGIVTQNIQNTYQGKIYPINPSEEKIGSLTCFKKIRDLPETPDLVIFATPAEITLNLLPEIGEMGCQNLLIFSAGFKEIGESGKKNEDTLKTLSQKYNFNIIGPNCLGFTNTNLNLNATFGKTSLTPGNLNLISQSGAVATALYDWAQSRGVGTNFTITIGNKTILNENHLLCFLQDKTSPALPGQSNLNPICLYLESIANGQELLQIGKNLTQNNPVVILKPGRTQAAATAMQSHTGSLAGDYEVFSSLTQNSGFILADGTEVFFNLCLALAWENPPQGNQIAVISNAGGPAVISADAINSSSLKLAEVYPETENILKQSLPRSASFHNPIDVLGDALADRFEIAINSVLNQENVHALLVIVTPQIMTEIAKTAEIIKTASQKFQKPIYCAFMGGSKSLEAQSILDQAKIPNFSYPESAISTLSKVWDWQNWRQKNKNQTETIQQPPINLPPDIGFFLKSQSTNISLLDSNSITQIFSNLGLPIPKSVVTTSYESAEEFTNQIGWPVVLKNVDPGRVHKSDDGGVVTNITSFIDFRKAWQKINPQNSIQIQVQEQVNTEYELILGMKRDSSFGEILNIGLGGKLANLYKDTNIIKLPTTTTELEALLSKSSYNQLFTGYRDLPKLSFHDLAKQIHILYSFFTQFPQIKEIEINPVTINHNDIFFTDPKIFLN